MFEAGARRTMAVRCHPGHPRGTAATGLEQRIEDGLAPVEGSRIEVSEEARPLVTFREAADQGGKR